MFAEEPMSVAALGLLSVRDSPDRQTPPIGLIYNSWLDMLTLPPGVQATVLLNRAEILPHQVSDMSSLAPPLLHLILTTETLAIIAISARQPM
jgi:hypothetical protein